MLARLERGIKGCIAKAANDKFWEMTVLLVAQLFLHHCESKNCTKRTTKHHKLLLYYSGTKLKKQNKKIYSPPSSLKTGFDQKYYIPN